MASGVRSTLADGKATSAKSRIAACSAADMKVLLPIMPASCLPYCCVGAIRLGDERHGNARRLDPGQHFGDAAILGAVIAP